MKKKILIVDDEPDIIMQTKGILEEAGYAISFADNKDEALIKIKSFCPDLIILDLVLSNESGFKVAQEIKSMHLYKNIPIVIVSYKKEPVDKHIAAKIGAIGYIEKPIDKNKLLFCVKDILDI